MGRKLTYYERSQRDREREEEREEKAAASEIAAAGALTLGAFAGAAQSIDKLSKYDGCYSLKFSNISRWVKESFMLSEEIVSERSV